MTSRFPSLSSLRRITSGGRFIPEIDGFRFVAILSVVLYHWHGFFAPLAGGTDHIRPLVEHGYRGVNLFYVVSGFILGLPFATWRLAGGAPVSLRAYFLRRLTRLEPPYILNLLIAFVAAGSAASVAHLLASLFYSHSFIYGAQNPMNPVTWTLEVEVQFYCLAPLLAGLYGVPSRRLRRAGMLALIVLLGALQLYFWDAPVRLRFSIGFALQFFLTGMLLADLYAADWHEAPATHWGWDVLSLLLWPLVWLTQDREVWVALPLLMGAACYCAFRGRVFRALFRHPLLTTTGGMCYTIYLFHYLLIPPVIARISGMGAGLPFDLRFAVQAGIYCAVVLGVSAVYFKLIEQPCMARDWPSRLRQRLRGLTSL